MKYLQFIVLGDWETFEKLNDDIRLVEIDPQKVSKEVLADLDAGYMKNIVRGGTTNGIDIVPITKKLIV